MHCCWTKHNSVGTHIWGINNSDGRWSHSTQYYQHFRQWVMSTVTALIYALLLRLVTAVQLQGFYFHHEEGRMERVREEERKITVAKRGFSTSSLTKSHHFRRLTSVCDKCSTSSSLPISLELETPEASAACKIKKWSPNSLKHKIHFWREEEKRAEEREKGSVSPAHYLTSTVSPQSVIIKWSTYSNRPVYSK